MAARTSKVGFGASGLPAVVKEIADRLRADDWERRSARDGGPVYYIVGFDAHVADVEGRIRFDSEFPPGKSQEQPKPLPPLALWQLRAEVAGRQAQYLAQAEARLRELGIESAKIVAAFRGEAPAEVRLSEVQSDDDFVQALFDYVQSLAIAKRAAVPTPDTAEFRGLREKHYLERIVRKFEAVVEKSSKLDALDFEDAQLWEASECFLYGFHRAAVVLAAAAVETNLRERTSLSDREPAHALIQAALSNRRIDEALAACAKEVFFIRNRVAHDKRSVDAAEAQHVLDLSRRLLSELHQPGG